MNREEVKQFCLKGARGCLLAALFSPLIVGASFYFPYIVPKTLFFQLMVEGALFFWTLLLALDRTYAPTFNVLSKAVLLFFGVFVFAAALGVNPARSFFGTYERMLSVVNFAHFVAFYFIARSVFLDARDWLLFFRTFVGVSILVSLYGVGQKLGWEMLYHPGIDRVDSTIGNAAFVAGYLMFAVAFALLLWMRDPHPVFRWCALGSVPLNLAVMFFTGTRGAALGLCAGILVFFAACAVKPKTAAISKSALAWGIGAVCGAALVAALLAAQGGGIYETARRFTSISFAHGTVQTRILSIQTGWEGFLARPVLGWGPENYNYVFDKYYNPKLYPAESWFDHAHNIFFDIADTMGVLGLAVYALLLLSLAYLMLRGVRVTAGAYWERMLLFSLVAAYFAQNIFVFDSLVTYLPFFMVLAYAGAGFPLGRGNEREKEKKERLFANPAPKVAVWLLPLFVAMVWWVNVRPAAAAFFTVQALKTPPEEARIAIDYFKKALSWSNFGRHEIRGKLADYAGEALVNENVRDASVKREVVEYTIGEMEKTLKEHPKDFRGYIYFATFLAGNHELLAPFGVPAVDRADEILAQAEPLGPRKPPLWLQWGRVKSLKKEHDKAVEYLERAVALNPDVNDTKLKLGLALQDAGRGKEALELYRAFLYEGDYDWNTYVQVAQGLANLNAPKDAEAAARKAVEKNAELKEESERFIQKLHEAFPGM